MLLEHTHLSAANITLSDVTEKRLGGYKAQFQLSSAVNYYETLIHVPPGIPIPDIVRMSRMIVIDPAAREDNAALATS